MDDDDDFDSTSMDFDEPSVANPAALLYGSHQYDYITPNTNTTNTSFGSFGGGGGGNSASASSSHRMSAGDIMRFGASRGNRGSSQDDDDLLMGSGSAGLPPRGFKPSVPDEKVIDKDFFNKFDDDFDDDDDLEVVGETAAPNTANAVPAPAPMQPQIPQQNTVTPTTNTQHPPVPPLTQ